MQVATRWTPPSGTLGELVLAARQRAASLEGAREVITTAARAVPTPPAFASALRRDHVAIIAEIKRSSPSRGNISPGLDAASRARDYAAGGAAAISVLTEPDRFGGSLEDLRAVRAHVELPVLRKDFLIDPLQLVETRALGASAGLVIVRAVDQTRLGELLSVGRELGLELLVEVHTEREVEAALSAGARVIGVNNRDLETLHVDPTVARRIIPILPANVIAVAESGVGGRSDVEAVAAVGADAVLVGTVLSSALDAAASVRGLSTVPRADSRRR